MKFKFVHTIYLCLFLISCDQSSKSTSIDEQQLSEIIVESRYRSLEQYEVGLGEFGEILGYWVLTFEEGTYSWSYSDLDDAGTFSINNEEITATSTDGTEYSVSYDWNNDVLYWDGIPYTKQE